VNVLRSLGFSSEPAASSASAQALPDVNGFVEIAINGDRRRTSVPVNDITATAVLTRGLAGLRAGDTADFLYTNQTGRYRFSTVCLHAERDEAGFALPAGIKTIESFANRRSAPRVPWLGSAQWRFAPGGRGYGKFLTASMMDISRGGASMVVARTLRPGLQVEVRFVLDPERAALMAISEVVRTTRLEKSFKNAAGIKFVDMGAEAQQMLGDFVRTAQAARRERGVV
jgi:c-di-GMP-binding flagellar brake protein YcgR